MFLSMSRVLSPKGKVEGLDVDAVEPTPKRKEMCTFLAEVFPILWLTFIHNSFLFRELYVPGSLRNPLAMYLIKLHSKFLI